MKSTILGSILVLILSACAPVTVPTGATPTAESTVSASTENPLANTQWTLTTFGETGAERPVVEGSAVTLECEEGGRAGGAGGCNSYGGTYQTVDGTLSFDQITSTLMACVDERVMQQEEEYFAALQTAGEFEITDDRLTIWYDGGQGVLNFNRGIAATPTPAGVTPATPEATSTPGEDSPAAIGGYDDLVEALRTAGAMVEPGGEVSSEPQPLFAVPGRFLTIDGDSVQVYVYPDAAAAESEAARISPDGFTMGTTIVEWVDTPHFYRQENIIVLYVGSDPATIALLQAVIDAPFAGGGTATATPTATPSDTAWIREQFGDAWDVAYPAGWTVNAAGAHEGAVQLQGQYRAHTYQINLSYPIGIMAKSLEAWVEAQLASLTPEQRAAVEVSDGTVANAPAQKVLNLPAAGGASPMHHVYIWRTDKQNPRLITIAQVDELDFDAAAMEALLDWFIAEVRGE